MYVPLSYLRSREQSAGCGYRYSYVPREDPDGQAAVRPTVPRGPSEEGRRGERYPQLPGVCSHHAQAAEKTRYIPLMCRVNIYL